MVDVSGPFDRIPLHAQYDPGSLEEPWYACTYVILDGVNRWKGDVFVRRQDSLEEWYAEQAGLIKPYPLPTDQLWHLWRRLGLVFVYTKEYRPAGRHFITDPAYYDFLRRYKQRDHTGVTWVTPHPPEPAPASEPEPVAHRGPGRPPDAEWNSWTSQELINILKLGLPLARGKNPDKKRLSYQNVADATGYERRDLSRAMKKYGHTWRTIRPLLND